MTENDDYYSEKINKIKDFVFGFVGVYALGFITSFLMVPIAIFAASSSSEIYIFSYLSILIGEIIAIIIAIVYFFRIKRRYISIGIISSIIFSIVLTLLLLGACMIALSGMG